MASDESKRTILVFGGGSTLGTDVVARFSMGGWRVVTLDYYDASVECGGVNGCLIPSADTMNLALPAGAPARTQARVATRCLEGALGTDVRVDVVLNATLGYTAGGVGDADALFDAWEYMQRTSVESSLVAAHLATRFLAPNGLLALVGSVAALANTRAPRLLGFGCAKAAVHQMVHLLAASDELPEEASVVALVPEVLDTPLHRSMNNGQSDGNWTPCDVVARKLFEWAETPALRPPNGALVAINTSVRDERVEHDTQPEHRFRLIEEASFVQSAQL